MLGDCSSITRGSSLPPMMPSVSWSKITLLVSANDNRASSRTAASKTATLIELTIEAKFNCRSLHYAAVGMTSCRLRVFISSNSPYNSTPLNLSSRPKRSVVEGPAVFSPCPDVLMRPLKVRHFVHFLKRFVIDNDFSRQVD